MTNIVFEKRVSVEEVEEGFTFQPKFDSNGLIPVITIEYETNEVLMHGYSNEEALKLTMSSKKAHYFSRSRQQIWKKGEKSGLFQNIKQIKIVGGDLYNLTEKNRDGTVWSLDIADYQNKNSIIGVIND